MKTRIGFGYDVHRLVRGRELWLGGIKIEHDYGLLGHSDADAVLHAVCDALLGAANLGDIGRHFPDTEDETLGIDSKRILQYTVNLLSDEGYHVENIDVTVCAEHPKLSPHTDAMRRSMANVIGTEENNISIKATTNEGLGFVGREEGIAAYAVALISKQ